MIKKTLVEEISDFRKAKKVLIPVLLTVGCLGLFLPVLPGLAFIFLGFVLLFPKQGNDLLNKIRKAFKKK